MMMIDRLHIGVQGASLMYIKWMMNGAGVLVLVDLGATHNIININITHSIGL